jgi:c-di-AMP phosphodiesterase-like protein
LVSKFGKVLKAIGRKWFIILVAIIIIIFIFNQIVALIMALITLSFFVLSYIPSIIFNKNLKGILNKATVIDDKTLSRKMNQSLEKIQKKMYILTKKQTKKSWLILYINRQYLYYSSNTIEAFKTCYNKGFGEREILEKLQNYGISTRAEVKAIGETLMRLKRLDDRDVSVKEFKNKQRFA